MGLIANYKYLSDKNLNELKALYTEKSRIKDILLALDNFDIEKAMESFSMEECKKANIYPDIWDYEEESEEIEEEIMDYFQNMKNFYRKILEVNGNVLVTIC